MTIITQDLLVDYIRVHPGCSPQEIEEELSSSASNIRWKISQLITKGLLRQEFEQNSRNKYRLYSTATNYDIYLKKFRLSDGEKDRFWQIIKDLERYGYRSKDELKARIAILVIQIERVEYHTKSCPDLKECSDKLDTTQEEKTK